MPSARKQKALRQRKRRGIYVLGALVVLVIIVGVGWYLYASAQSPAIVYAKLNTSLGPIEIELYRSKTPQTVTNFVNLAKSGFYDNLVWHRILKGFVIQTGDPLTRNGSGDRSTWGTGGSPQKIPLEYDASLHNYAGYLAMAHLPGDVNSGTSQFFINLVDNSKPPPALDGGYTVFGKVIGNGMDVALAIANLPVDSSTNGQPLDPLPFLTSVTVSNTP